MLPCGSSPKPWWISEVQAELEDLCVCVRVFKFTQFAIQSRLQEGRTYKNWNQRKCLLEPLWSVAARFCVACWNQYVAYIPVTNKRHHYKMYKLNLKPNVYFVKYIITVSSKILHCVCWRSFQCSCCTNSGVFLLCCIYRHKFQLAQWH